MLGIIEFRWVYKGLQLTVRFHSWRQAPDLLCRGSAEGTLRIPRDSNGRQVAPSEVARGEDAYRFVRGTGILHFRKVL